VNDKTCEFCEDLFNPRNWKDRACSKEQCQSSLRRSKLDARNAKTQPTNPDRPSTQQCQWADCSVVFPVFYKGVIPKFCPTHREPARQATRRINRSTTRLCAWQNCGQPFAISKRGSASIYCSEHRKEAKRIQRLQNTLDAPCSHPLCNRQQHGVGHGWCAGHEGNWLRYKLTGEAWLFLLDGQNSMCPICNLGLLDGAKIHIDHDHACCPGTQSCGKCTRGLLHELCNMNAVGQIETALFNGTFYSVLSYLFGVPAARIERALEPITGARD
jgi:hypothetical protein